MAVPFGPTEIKIRNVFDVTDTYRYRVKGQIYADDSAANSFKIETADSTFTTKTTMFLYPSTFVGQTWIGFDFETTLNTSDYRNMLITVGRSGTGFGFDVYLKNFRVYKVSKAEVQDSDIVGKRFYDGTKMTSTDINVDSPDTIDGGPVITVNTVPASSPSSNPIGTSLGPNVAVTMTQQQQTGNA